MYIYIYIYICLPDVDLDSLKPSVCWSSILGKEGLIMNQILMLFILAGTHGRMAIIIIIVYNYVLHYSWMAALSR